MLYPLARVLFFPAALSLTFSIAHGATGTHLIGLSPRSTAMAGTGISAALTGADALYRNPAQLLDASGVPGTVAFEASLNAVNFKSEVDAGSGYKANQMGTKYLPALATTYRWDEKWAIGFGLYAYGGAAIDQNNQAALKMLKTELSMFRFSPSVAWRPVPELSVGVAPFLKYGAFALNENITGGGVQSGRAPHGGVGAGAVIGASVEATDGFRVGASFTTAAGVEYKDVADLDRLGPGATDPSLYGLDSIRVQSPHELGLGVSYTQHDFRILVEYRWVAWSNADGYRELGWKDQSVWSAGAEYTRGWWAFRLGVLTTNSPIESNISETGVASVDFQGHPVFVSSISTLNLVAFPAMSTTHLSVGTGYTWGEGRASGVDLAFVYMPTIARERAGSGYDLRAKVASWQLGLGLRQQL